MEELTLRLPAGTKESLQAAAAERGVTLGEHIRDIIDAYQSKNEEVRDRPEIDVEYAHAVQKRRSQMQYDGQARATKTETIGTFSYGPGSIYS